MFPLFQTLGILLDCHDFSEVIESSLYLPVPSGPWDASCQVPQTCLCSGSSDGLESDLLLQWVGLHSPVSVLIFRGLRDVGNSVGRENLRKNVAEFIRPPLLHVSCHQIPCLIYQRGTGFFVFLSRVTCLSGFWHISSWH